MSVKEENEITVRVIGSDEELRNKLKEKGLKEGRKFTLDDDDFVPNVLDITKLSSREILSKAIYRRWQKNNFS